MVTDLALWARLIDNSFEYILGREEKIFFRTSKSAENLIDAAKLSRNSIITKFFARNIFSAHFLFCRDSASRLRTLSER